MAVADAAYLDWPEVPPAPAALRVTRASGRARLQWTSGGAIRRIELQRSLDYGPWQAAGETSAATSEYSDPLLAKGHTTWRVRAWGGKGASPWSNPAWIER
jgi:hypothetical protein